MSEEKVFLFIDDSEESVEARQTLEVKNIPFDAIPSSGTAVPSASYGYDIYTGVSGIRILAQGLAKYGPYREGLRKPDE